MRRNHANPLPDADFDIADDTHGPSKTRRKEAMQSLQDLGERLVTLPLERLKKTPLPDSLRDAVMDARRFTQHGAIRRQMQYIGKLMRDIDAAPIEAALAAFDGASAVETARMHRIERERDALIENESVLTDIGNRHPGADLQRLRQLRRNVLRERNENKPPRAYREIFQVLKELEAGGVDPLFSQVAATESSSDPTGDQESPR